MATLTAKRRRTARLVRAERSGGDVERVYPAGTTFVNPQAAGNGMVVVHVLPGRMRLRFPKDALEIEDDGPEIVDPDPAHHDDHSDSGPHG